MQAWLRATSGAQQPCTTSAMPHSTTSLSRPRPPKPGQQYPSCGCQRNNVRLDRVDDRSRHKFLEVPFSLLSEHEADVLVGKGFDPRRLGESANIRVLRTGDLGQLTQHGLQILGRSDRQVKLSGMCPALCPCVRLPEGNGLGRGTA